jgi:hypothetical protein
LTAFLLGSGVSLAAQMPSVKAIAGRVLSGEGVRHHTDGTYYFGKPLYAHIGFPDEYVPRVVMFLKRLEIEIALYYFHEVGRVVNYEDLYYTASQIRDSEVGEYDNPVVRPFIQRILPEVKGFLGGRAGETRRRWRLARPCRRPRARPCADPAGAGSGSPASASGGLPQALACRLDSVLA